MMTGILGVTFQGLAMIITPEEDILPYMQVGFIVMLQ